MCTRRRPEPGKGRTDTQLFYYTEYWGKYQFSFHVNMTVTEKNGSVSCINCFLVLSYDANYNASYDVSNNASYNATKRRMKNGNQ